MATLTDVHPHGTIDQRDLQELLSWNGQLCVSIYMPTTFRFNEAQEMQNRFRGLCDEAEKKLGTLDPPHGRVQTVMQELRHLQEDLEFFRNQLDGLAVFRTPERLAWFRLLRAPRQGVHVGEALNLTPLVRIAQDATRFNVLALSAQSVALFEGNRDRLEQVRLNGHTLNEGHESRLTLPHTRVRPIEANDFQFSGGTEDFFRHIDRLVIEHHSGRTALPLLLMALPQHQSLFRGISQNHHLLEARIERDPFKDMNEGLLRERVWQVLEPVFKERIAKQRDAFREAAARQQGSDELKRVAEAASAGRIGVLFIEDNKQVPGKIDRGTGAITEGVIAGPTAGNLLDELAEMVLRADGQVYILPREEMPTASPVAAIERWKQG
jgi:hypothetical protein